MVLHNYSRFMQSRWTIRSAIFFVKSGETFDERAAQTFTIQHRARGCEKLRGAFVTLEGPHGLGSAVTVDRVFLGAGMAHCRGVLVATITQRGDSALFVSTVVSMQLQRVYLWRHCQIVAALLLIVPELVPVLGQKDRCDRSCFRKHSSNLSIAPD